MTGDQIVGIFIFSLISNTYPIERACLHPKWVRIFKRRDLVMQSATRLTHCCRLSRTCPSDYTV